MGVGVHGEPGAYIVVTLMSLVREDFIDGASWMLLECWGTDARIGPGGWDGLGLSASGFVGSVGVVVGGSRGGD